MSFMKSTQNINVTLIYLVFFLSGMAGLIYEISWARQIGLLFGHTVQAASTVLASYFAGMGLGYWLGARLSRHINPLLGYGVAELIIGVWAIGIPVIIGISESPDVSPWLSSHNGAWQILIRGVFCFTLMLPATILMGATLPMMAEVISNSRLSEKTQTQRPIQTQSPSQTSARVTTAYSINTFGALAGTMLSTFVLLINIGVCGSSYIAVSLSWICGAVALALVPTTADITCDNKSMNQNPSKPQLSFEILLLAFFSGFGTLALQVLFTRMFALVFHNSTYTFGVVIAVFLAALAIGAAIAARLQRSISTRTILTVSVASGSLLTPMAIVVFVHWTELRYFSWGTSFAEYLVAAVFLVALTIGPSILSLAMVLPLVWTMAGVSQNAGGVVGILTSVNTFGAALGALSASFLMLVYVGLWQSIVVIAFIFFLLAIYLMVTAKRLVVASGFTGLFLVAAFFAAGSAGDAKSIDGQNREQIVKRFHSSYGWIDVVKFDDRSSFTYKIRQNLHYRFGRTGGNAREFRQAHIPLLMSGDPDSVLFLGLGTGLTAGGAIAHQNVQTIDAVELIPEVVDAARMLSDFNNDVIDHPKTTIHIDDARHFLLATEKRFDVIVSDLFVPWESESGYLYTVEHYRVAEQRLNQGGLFCQWLPMYQMGEVEFELIANSFAKVFPHTTIWWGQLSQRKPVVALIGSRKKIVIDPQRLRDDLDSVNRHRDSVDPAMSSVERFWRQYAGDWKPTSTTRLNTDEFPRVEFLTPLSSRSRKLLSGPNFEDYYHRTLRTLAANDARLTGLADQPSTAQLRAGQRLVLFGSED